MLNNFSFARFNVFLRICFSADSPVSFFLQQVAQVIGRQAKFVGAILNGRDSFRSGLSGTEIAVQQGFEAGKDIAVQVFAGDELAVVKTDAVIEQQLHVVRDQRFAVFVRRVQQLGLNFLHAFGNDFSLLFGKVQGFVGVVGKIGVAFY